MGCWYWFNCLLLLGLKSSWFSCLSFMVARWWWQLFFQPLYPQPNSKKSKKGVWQLCLLSIFLDDPPNDFSLYFADQNYVMWLLLSVRKARKYVLSGNISMYSIVDSVDKQEENGYRVGSLQSVPHCIPKAEKYCEWIDLPSMGWLSTHTEKQLRKFLPKAVFKQYFSKEKCIEGIRENSIF